MQQAIWGNTYLTFTSDAEQEQLREESQFVFGLGFCIACVSDCFDSKPLLLWDLDGANFHRLSKLKFIWHSDHTSFRNMLNASAFAQNMCPAKLCETIARGIATDRRVEGTTRLNTVFVVLQSSLRQTWFDIQLQMEVESFQSHWLECVTPQSCCSAAQTTLMHVNM